VQNPGTDRKMTCTLTNEKQSSGCL